MTATQNSLEGKPKLEVQSKKAWVGRTAVLLALVGLAGVVYVLFQAMSKPAERTGYGAYAQGAMAKLLALPDAPAQSTRPFKDAQGRERTLAEWRGKVIAVNFWATWCQPCVMEMPTLAKLDAAFEGRPFEVVAVSLDRLRDHDLAKATISELSGGRFDFYIDSTMTILPDSAVPEAPTGMPTTILYDRQGKELARLAGEADWSSPEAKRLIEAALSEVP